MPSPRSILLALALTGIACARGAPAEPPQVPGTPEARRTPDPTAMSVSDVLAKGPSSLADMAIVVHGRVSQPFMTWDCPPGATCKPRPDIAPVMILGDATAARRELWVIRCPEVASGFSPEVGMLVDVHGVVRVDRRGGVQLEHRETVLLSR